MKTHKPKSGLTLIEMTVVILVMMTLLGTGLFVTKQYGTWQLARAASENLRTVYAAQRMFLADNPTTIVADITPAQIISYLPNRGTALPTIKSLSGTTLTIKVNVTPPVIDDGAGGVYDPSGNATDSLWDVGQ